MFRVSGTDADVWLIGETAPFRVPLVSEDGWVWRPADESVRHWLDAQVLDCSGAPAPVERLTLRSGRVELSRCLAGPLVADGVCRTLSLHSRWGHWTTETLLLGGERVFGGERPRQARDTQALLQYPDGSYEPPQAQAGLLARLKHGSLAFEGEVVVSDMADDRLTLRFREEVEYGAC